MLYTVCSRKEAETLYAKRAFVGLLFMADSYNKQSREHHLRQHQHEISPPLTIHSRRKLKLIKRDVKMNKNNIHDDDNHSSDGEGRDKQSAISSYVQIKLEPFEHSDCNVTYRNETRVVTVTNTDKKKRLESISYNTNNSKESIPMIRLSYINTFD